MVSSTPLLVLLQVACSFQRVGSFAVPQKRPLHLSTRVLPPPSTLVTAAAAAASGGGEGESSEKGLSEEVAPLLRRPKLEGSAVVLLPLVFVLTPRVAGRLSRAPLR